MGSRNAFDSLSRRTRLFLRGANPATASTPMSAKTITSKKIDHPKVITAILPLFREQVVSDSLTVL
jgi:hypothetical protein